MATTHSATIYAPKGKLGIRDMDEHIVYTGASGSGIFQDVLDILPVFAKNV